MDAFDRSLAQSIVGGKHCAVHLDETLVRVQIAPVLVDKDTAPVVAAPKSAPAQGAAQVRYYYGNFDPNVVAVYKALAEQFMHEHPNISVSVEDIFRRMTRIGSKDLSKNFDCYYSNIPIINEEATNLFLDVSPFFKIEAQAFQQDFDTGILNIYRAEGRLFRHPVSPRLKSFAITRICWQN